MPVKRHRAANGGCHASNKSGTRCAAPAVKGTRLCSLHADPKRAAEIGCKGGKRNLKLYDSGPQNVSIPESPADVRGRALRQRSYTLTLRLTWH
jgi:general stress protein YciG